jgi:hypothetical protein
MDQVSKNPQCLPARSAFLCGICVRILLSVPLWLVPVHLIDDILILRLNEPASNTHLGGQLT